MNEQEIFQCVQSQQEVFQSYDIHIPQSGLLAGLHKPVFSKTLFKNAFGEDNVHFPMGDAVLKYGVQGVLELTAKRTAEDTEETAVYRQAVHGVYIGVREFILKHMDRALEMKKERPEDAGRLQKIADNCQAIVCGKPRTFIQALQLFWFLYLLRRPFGGGCIGRLDQKLYTFCKSDMERGAWNREEAMEAVMQFYGYLNEIRTGDTLRNLMLSGQDEGGRDLTNELTWVFLEAYERTGDAEPHLNVRLHPGSPEELKKTCVRMLSEGKGQPTLYFDRWIMPAMERAGIAHTDACRYANDGCTETVIDGRSHIAFWQHEMVKTVELTMFNGEENPFIYPVSMRKNSRDMPEFTPETGLLTGFRSGEIENMDIFDDFLSAFKAQLWFQLDRELETIGRKIHEDETVTMTSPFLAGTFEDCLITGRDPLRGGGFSVHDYQLLSGTVTTAADSLRAIEYCVFEKRYCTLTELREAMAVDFEGHEPLRQRLLHAPKYGCGEERADELAAWISRLFIDRVDAYRTKSGKRVWPGLYNIDFKIFANVTGATPDGRRFRDPIAEHCSPTPGVAKKGPTAIVESASRLPMREGYASSPLHITLNKSDFVMGADRVKIVEKLMGACDEAGVPVLNISMYDASELRRAQQEPERYKDLIVRVWGFNARFVELDEELQEHIIRRIC